MSRNRPLTRGLRTKLIVAMALAGVVIAFHDRLARILAVPGTAGITTGAISTTTANVDPSLTESAEIKAYDGPVESLSLSGDGRLIVTTSRQPELKLWSFDTHDAKGTIALEDGPATSLVVRNNRAITGHANGTVALYDLDTKQRLYRFKRNDAQDLGGGVHRLGGSYCGRQPRLDRGALGDVVGKPTGSAARRS